MVSEIPLEPSVEWKDFSARLDITPGKHPLYFTYEGQGALDFKEFSFIK